MPSSIQAADTASQVVQLSNGSSAKSGAPAGKSASPDKASEVRRQELPIPGQPVPAGEQQQASEKSSQSITEAVSDINNFVQSMQRDLHFSVDEDTERVVIKVLDHETGELVRQIPAEEVLRIAKNLEQYMGLIFKEEA